MKIALLAAAALAFSLTAAAQNPQLAAHDPAMVFPIHDVHAQLAKLIPEARADGGSGAMIADYGTYHIMLSVRAKNGGAEVHRHWDDVMIVEQGTATLITGGTLRDEKMEADGEGGGSGIEGGQSRTVRPGDVITVHAGTPHQLVLAPGAIYSAVVIKIHEP